MAIEESVFPVGRLADVAARPGDFRLVERVPLTVGWEAAGRVDLAEVVGDECRMVLLDLETTGFNVDEEKIIELGMVEVLYSPSARRITSVLRAVSMLEDPGKPITEEITGITGITDEMVAGLRIDEAVVNDFLGDGPVVVAHSASFDRPFFDRRFPAYADLSWGCTLKGVDWRGLGFEGSKLEYLLMKDGWFYGGHRAAVDCLAMAWLLHRRADAFAMLLDSVAAETVVVRAFGAPYAVKDLLKARGYKWHGADDGRMNKHWWIEIPGSALGDEQEYLDSEYRDGSTLAHYSYMDATKRFKSA